MSEGSLFKAVSETFEIMGFMESAPLFLVPNFEPPPMSRLCRASLDVVRPVAGRMGLVMSEILLREVASGIMGVSPEDVPGDELMDTLAELINTACGKYMALVVPESESFSLGLPETACDVTVNRDAAYSFVVNGSLVWIELEGDCLE